MTAAWVTMARALLAILTALLTAAGASGYPLDGGEYSGIARLQGYLRAQQIEGPDKLPAGALLGLADIRLQLVDYRGPDFDAKPPDPTLQSALEQVIARRHRSYAVVVVDYSDPGDIRWAGVRPDRESNPGSVGKLLCLVGLFDSLARARADVSERARLLREHQVLGGDWATSDHHVVPHYDPKTGRNRHYPVRQQDVFSLSEWLDHMVSPSANAAANVVWREAMLLRHFGTAYPPPAADANTFFRDTPRAQLGELAQRVLNEPLQAAGLPEGRLQQGAFWTKSVKRRIPIQRSFANPRELARLLFRLEQGRLVDSWSSLEMKRYLYLTKRRYRYAYPPELHGAAIYFKSGSLYKCQAEEGQQCGKYQGNVYNLMSSTAIVESPAGAAEQRRYLVALMSNVLRVNAAWDHARLAAAIHEIVQGRQPVPVRDQGNEQEKREAGRG